MDGCLHCDVHLLHGIYWRFLFSTARTVENTYCGKHAIPETVQLVVLLYSSTPFAAANGNHGIVFARCKRPSPRVPVARRFVADCSVLHTKQSRLFRTGIDTSLQTSLGGMSRVRWCGTARETSGRQGLEPHRLVITAATHKSRHMHEPTQPLATAMAPSYSCKTREIAGAVGSPSSTLQEKTAGTGRLV